MVDSLPCTAGFSWVWLASTFLLCLPLIPLKSCWGQSNTLKKDRKVPIGQVTAPNTIGSFLLLFLTTLLGHILKLILCGVGKQFHTKKRSLFNRPCNSIVIAIIIESFNKWELFYVVILCVFSCRLAPDMI